MINQSLIFLVLLLEILSTLGDNDYGWYVTRYNKESFRPNPPQRSKPQFHKKNDTHAIFYGGFRERIQLGQGNHTFFNDMYLLDVSNPELVNWTKVNYAPSSPVPFARAFECSVYSASNNALYLYGGTIYFPNLQGTVFGDSWVFHFDTLTWTLLDSVAPPGNRGGHSCVLDITGENAIVGYGIFTNAPPTPTDKVWKWHLATNTWTDITSAGARPVSRWVHGFGRIPGSKDFLLLNGRIPTNQNYLTDVWKLDGETFTWTQLSVSNIPNPPHEAATYAFISSKWILMSGGDADGNLTVADTCKPPLICVTVVTPQDTNFFLKLKLNQAQADWEDEADFEHTTTRHRHAAVVVMEPYLYMYGGHDWDGLHGIGEIYNTLLWGIKIPNKYW
jgi:hypothetical protein